MKAVFVTSLFLMLNVTTVFGHGMDKPGPNNGFIKMPGTYHIELVNEQSALKIYFLDLTFKPLTIEKASVKTTLVGEKNEILECVKASKFFQCNLKKISLKKFKEVVVESSKGGEKAAVSRYSLPLAH